MSRSIQILGSAIVDIFVRGVPRIPPRPHAEFTLANFVRYDSPLVFTTGGNGANCAYVLAGLEAKVVLSSSFASDLPGRLVRDWLESRGVRLDLHPRTKATVTHVIVTDRQQRRMSFFYDGGIRYDHVKLRRDASAICICGWPHPPLAQVAKLFREARRRGVVTAFDIGPTLGQKFNSQTFAPLFELIDYFIGNEHELKTFTGARDEFAAAERVLACGVRNVFLHLGPHGCGLLNRDGLMRAPAFKTSARNTIGAGDSLNAGFLDGLVRGWPMSETLLWANAIAALVVSSDRGVVGAPTAAEALKFLKSC